MRGFLLWGPVLALMGLIFFFSAQPKGSPVLEEFPLPAGMGHFVGYLLLGFLLYRAFNKGLSGWSLRAGGYSFATGFVYAISDELHQLFVPGRECSLADIGLDESALVTALVGIKLWSLFHPHLHLELRGEKNDFFID